jgi:hypothetical protein
MRIRLMAYGVSLRIMTVWPQRLNLSCLVRFYRQPDWDSWDCKCHKTLCNRMLNLNDGRYFNSKTNKWLPWRLLATQGGCFCWIISVLVFMWCLCVCACVCACVSACVRACNVLCVHVFIAVQCPNYLLIYMVQYGWCSSSLPSRQSVPSKHQEETTTDSKSNFFTFWQTMNSHCCPHVNTSTIQWQLKVVRPQATNQF